jgi:four helix bundle protein
MGFGNSNREGKTSPYMAECGSAGGEQKVVEGKKKAKSYRDLLVWQKGISLVKDVYQLTRMFPEAEKYGLISQMRRAAVSIPSIIAEGQARHTRKEFIQFLSHAEGSFAELETQMLISVELGFCKLSDIEEPTNLATELSKMLDSLRRKLEVKV